MAKAQRTGVIRDYDMHSASVRVGYGFIFFFCLIMTVIAVFPIIWVVLAGFKDLKEFMSSAKLLPEVFDFLSSRKRGRSWALRRTTLTR